jgi:DNA-binding MarR family transcriptional regulator
MAESRSLRLLLQLADTQKLLVEHVAHSLTALGYSGVTSGALGFLGQLDCGPNHASEIARHLGVSRQMVAKTVTEMEQKGWLEQVPDPHLRNRKVIRFTAAGEQLMSNARATLAELDEQLDREFGSGWIASLADNLTGLKASLMEAGND